MVDDSRECPPNTEKYVIKAGDTLYELTQRFETTISALIGANPNIDPDNLQVGQEICIPLQERFPSCPEGNFYSIQPGDTLYKIAQRFNISVDDLQEANPRLDSQNLNVGEIICIPLATPPVECPESTVEYQIQAGDTFYEVAKRFGTTVEELQRLNPDVNPDALLIGQTICVPKA
ncbi:LysM peptidoglycan-binding domain-containing protein [Acetohalobium arabaticum]|uniref:Peptidoglycan-binding lysin domain protein n=1 Tax=Acetohalobium arabaticum (strain ATCC 49924 / DSM 5501 / Z-7288) TaxID=574087 RepID=D9QQF5_ACEAZ|nr:LysM domain-containing protein [Acetohalobium arabaticum]ADL12746.1 Peptidoglycan-binding lysin domain protein [Acetohalobium arabaticum DSM 5501]